MRSLFARIVGRIRPFCALAAIPFVSGCNMIVLNPAGDVAQQQADLVVISTILMLLIIVPVMALTIAFAWRYRASNKEATYRPDWDHSTELELVIWAAPLLIIICLGAVTWVGTHLLDPYRTLARTAPGQPVARNTAPLEVDVVALDWKWLFIYPQQGVATVNELAVPVGQPLRFRISASSVMNSFYIPALAGQIYAMPAMETTLHGVFNKTGEFTGFSANYSGAGFSNMRFGVKSLSAADFSNWVATARGGKETLDRSAYLALEKPSEKEPVRRYAAVENGLFDKIVNLCVEPGKMCMHDMMAIDARGGLGSAGAYNIRELAYDKYAGRGSEQLPVFPANRRFVAAVCATPMISAERPLPGPSSLAPLQGAGLSRPEAKPRTPPLALVLERAPQSRPLS